MVKSWYYIRPNVKDNFNKLPEHLLNESRLPFSRSKEEAWQNIQIRIAETKETGIYRINRFSPALRWAAGIAIVLGVLVSLAYLTGNVTINSGDSIMADAHVFPDGSEVSLNANTELSYNKWFWHLSRDVDMVGEAFYSVQKGRSFEVQTPEGNVLVLGTSFNVLATPGVFEVSCKTGKVAVSDFTGLTTTLEPGMSASLANTDWNLVEVPVNLIGNWVEEEFYFEDTAVSEVFQIIGKETNYKFVIQDKLEMTYSGQIDKNQDINDILNIICLPLNLSYKIDGNLITITKK